MQKKKKIGAKKCLTHPNVYVNRAAMPNVKVHAVCYAVVAVKMG